MYIAFFVFRLAPQISKILVFLVRPSHMDFLATCFVTIARVLSVRCMGVVRSQLLTRIRCLPYLLLATSPSYLSSFLYHLAQTSTLIISRGEYLQRPLSSDSRIRVPTPSPLPHGTKKPLGSCPHQTHQNDNLKCHTDVFLSNFSLIWCQHKPRDFNCAPLWSQAYS